MSTIIGLVIVFASVLGGFSMVGGSIPVLLQPNEFLVIGGSAAGALVISAPGKVRGRVIAAFKTGFFGRAPSKEDYKDLLLLLYKLFQLMRREGILSLETHVWEPEKSPVFQQHPSVLKNHHAATFLVEGLKQLIDGCPVDDLAAMFETDLETHDKEEHEPVHLLHMVSDSLPGLGIVAAVLGIIVTMGHLDGGPEEIGYHVAAALVGTFLGILLCYGVMAPISTAIEMTGKAHARYMGAIKAGLLAAARGVNPAVAIEFARRSLYTDERPPMAELEEAIKGAKEA